MELLNAIGFVYSAKAKQFLAANQSFLGVGGWLHNVQGKYHVFSETCVFNPSSVCPPLSHRRSAACRLCGRQLSSRPFSTRYSKPNNLATSVPKRRNASRNRPQRRASKRSSRYVFVPFPASLAHREFCLIDARALYIRARSSRSTRCCERRATGC